MPKGRQPVTPKIIKRVTKAHDEVEETRKAYHDAQKRLLRDLRWARDNGETLDNLADALGCTKQWIHRWTSFGKKHNKAYVLVDPDIKAS
mgnify:FL=1